MEIPSGDCALKDQFHSTISIACCAMFHPQTDWPVNSVTLYLHQQSETHQLHLEIGTSDDWLDCVWNVLTCSGLCAANCWHSACCLPPIAATTSGPDGLVCMAAHGSRSHAQTELWSYRPLLKECSGYMLPQQVLHSSRASWAIRNVYLWFYLFCARSVSRWRNYILLTANEMRVLVRLHEFNMSLLCLWHVSLLLLAYPRQSEDWW